MGALAPLLLFLVGVTWLGLSGAPDERGFWPVLLASLLLATLLARDPEAYAEAAVEFVARPVVVLMLLAWMLAGALGAVLRASGLVDALVEVGAAAGLRGGLWVGATFLVGALLSTSTGTSLGTLILAVPLLYPAGVALAADPVWLLGALLGGATFGDNLSPISDTTIASASTQGAPIARVVRSRLRYALPCGALALIAFSLLGGGDAAPQPVEVLPRGGLDALWMLLAPALVLVLLLRGRHLIVGLLWGVGAACAIGLASGRIAPRALLSLDRENFVARSLLLDGVGASAGLCLVTVLLMALIGGFETSGLLDRLLSWAERRARGRRTAEWASFAAISGATLLTTHSGVAILSVGTLVRRLGERFAVAPTRRANLIDLTVCTYPFLLPWFIPTLLASGLARGLAGAAPGPFEVGLANLYSWLLLGLTLLAIATGWGSAAGDDETTSATARISGSAARSPHRNDDA